MLPTSVLLLLLLTRAINCCAPYWQTIQIVLIKFLQRYVFHSSCVFWYVICMMFAFYLFLKKNHNNDDWFLSNLVFVVFVATSSRVLSSDWSNRQHCVAFGCFGRRKHFMCIVALWLCKKMSIYLFGKKIVFVGFDFQLLYFKMNFNWTKTNKQTLYLSTKSNQIKSNIIDRCQCCQSRQEHSCALFCSKFFCPKLSSCVAAIHTSSSKSQPLESTRRSNFLFL